MGGDGDSSGGCSAISPKPIPIPSPSAPATDQAPVLAHATAPEMLSALVIRCEACLPLTDKPALAMPVPGAR